MLKLFLFFLLSFTPLATFGKITIHNTAQDFYSSWNKNKGLKKSARVRAFKRDVLPRFPSYYNAQFREWERSGLSVEEAILNQLNEFSSISNSFVFTALELEADIKLAIRTFRSYFPDLREDFKIFILHSLGDVDGGVRIIGGKEYLVFGVEKILKFHDFFDRTSFILHELFHIYHFQKYPEKIVGELWEHLWLEGLAVYVSSVLNPKASLKELMLDVPTGLIGKSEASREIIVEDLLKAFNSVNPADYARFFQLGGGPTFVPSRSGYYFGLLIARQLADSYPLERLITLSGNELKSLIKRELEKLLHSEINFSWNKDLPPRGKS